MSADNSIYIAKFPIYLIKMEIDYSKIDNIVFGDVRYNDYPDFCDAYIESADYDGNPMSEEMLDEINEDSQFVHESLLNYLN